LWKAAKLIAELIGKLRSGQDSSQENSKNQSNLNNSEEKTKVVKDYWF
jgi:hypothetical protein